MGAVTLAYGWDQECKTLSVFSMLLIALNHINNTLFFFIQVEALLGYRVMDIACGSGDAQTLCITDDDNVWSWGDGDYGKLGRGGSDGCKVNILFSYSGSKDKRYKT